MEPENRQTNDARMVLYAFIRSFLDVCPNSEKFTYWQELLRAMTSSGTGSAALDRGFSALSRALSDAGLTGCRNEYYELFENPFSTSRIQLCASYYTDGKIMGPSLVKLRQLLYNLNIGKAEDFKEPEDHLVFLIDVMMHLIERQADPSAQQQIVEGHVAPAVGGVLKRLEELRGFRVYQALFETADAFVTLERSLFPSDR